MLKADKQNPYYRETIFKLAIMESLFERLKKEKIIKLKIKAL